MARSLRILLIIFLLLLSACARKEKLAEARKISSVTSIETSQSGHISTFELAGHEIHVYQPEDILHGELINYSYTAPLLLVFGDRKLDAQDAADFICSKGIDRTAQENGAAVVYVNPETKWRKEDYGLYEILLSKTKIAQTNSSDGLLYQDDTREYFLFNSGARTIVYGYGEGGDYIARNYLKQLEGISAMSYLGVIDITITAAVLDSLSREPVIDDRNIIIVSINNSDIINSSIEKKADYSFVTEDDFSQIYDEHIAPYQRVDGSIIGSFDRKKSGQLMDALVFEIKTTEDNHYIRSDTYRLGALVFRNEKTDAKKRPLLMCFHGGGDTALLTASISGWDQIAWKEDFILCAIEMHTRTTASEVMQVIDQLTDIYDIDETRIYATGFSMGGIKTWDLYQEYPDRFAALAPMGATVEVGMNCQFSTSPSLNEETIVPIFVAGGQSSNMEELPFQGRTAVNRINYLFDINDIERNFEMSFGNRNEWEDSVYGYQADYIEEYQDESHPLSTTTIRSYKSENGNIYTALCSISAQSHEIRPLTCEKAWEFMKRYSRNADGSIRIGE